MKVAVQQSELFQDDLGALHPLRAFIFVELFLQIAIDLFTRDQLALYAVLNRQLGVAADKVQDLVDRAEELLRLRLGHRRLCRWRSRRLLACGSRLRCECHAGSHADCDRREPTYQNQAFAAKSSLQPQPPPTSL